MEGLIMFAQLILGLSILVGLHELGHLLTAKAFGMRVEKFSIGFPPKLFGVRWGETEYSIGALPLGGFVKISGMIDESLDTSQMKKDPEPWEFRSKPAWQRMIVMLGGIIVNVITGVFIFICIVYFLGETYYSTQEVNKYGIYVSELGEEIGLKKGDKIIKVNGKAFENFFDARNPALLMENGSYYTVLRDGQEIDVPIPSNFLDKMADAKGNFMDALLPFEVDSVREGSNAWISGLKKGDRIVMIDSTEVAYFQDFSAILDQKKCQSIALVVNRGGESKALRIPVDADGKLGFYPRFLLEPSVKQFGVWESVQAGTQEAFGMVALQIKAFSKIFKNEMSATKSISGPIGIAQIFGGSWDMVRFWTLVAMLSMVLAFMNLLPIPALDGGHVMFLTYEMIAGRPPSDKFLEASQRIGMVLLLFLMVFAFGNDIVKVFFDQPEVTTVVNPTC